MGRRPALAGACALAPAARADCFDEAAACQHVNPAPPRAIAWQESHGRGDDAPPLSRLPLLGGLFRNKQDEKRKFQRLFLLTPRIATPL